MAQNRLLPVLPVVQRVSSISRRRNSVASPLPQKANQPNETSGSYGGSKRTHVPSSVVMALVVTAFVLLVSTVLAVEAVGPKYMTSNPPHDARSTRSKQRLPPPKPQYQSWMIQQKRRSAMGVALQPPTTRQFLDQCVSLLEVLDVMAVRGGGWADPYESGPTNPPSSSDDDNDDWRNVNNNNHNHPHQYDDDTDNNNDDDYYYYDYSNGNQPSPPQTRRRDRTTTTTWSRVRPNLLQKVDRKTGLMLLVSGVSVTFLGITLFFNKTIIRLGHLLGIAGVLLSMGLSQTIQYFVQPEKLRATICLGIGVFLVFIGSPLFGLVLEVFGILNLFGNMFPIIMIMIKQMPIIGPLLKSTNNSKNNNNNKRSRRNNDDDYYYSSDSRRQSQPPSSHPPYEDENDGLGRRY